MEKDYEMLYHAYMHVCKLNTELSLSNVELSGKLLKYEKEETGSPVDLGSEAYVAAKSKAAADILHHHLPVILGPDDHIVNDCKYVIAAFEEEPSFGWRIFNNFGHGFEVNACEAAIDNPLKVKAFVSIATAISWVAKKNVDFVSVGEDGTPFSVGDTGFLVRFEDNKYVFYGPFRVIREEKSSSNSWVFGDAKTAKSFVNNMNGPTLISP